MERFFTADLHFAHQSIIRHCDRPYDNVHEMNEALVENWNSVVTEKSLVYILGDFAWMRPDYWMDRLNGQKILVIGNHDTLNSDAKKKFQFIKPMYETKIDGQSITMCHYQMSEWNKSFHGSWHLYGHSHGNATEWDDKLSFDIGTDLWNYTPVHWDTVVNKMQHKMAVRDEIKAQREAESPWVPGQNRIKITEFNQQFIK